MGVTDRSVLNPGRALDWNETIHFPDEGDGVYQEDEFKVVDPHWVEAEELLEPGKDWNPVQDLTQYLATLFEGEEYVGYSTEAYTQDAETHIPKKGTCDRTAGTLIQKLGECNGDIGGIFGDTKEEIGAWIRFNPLDGKDVRDANVTSYRFALVEYDEIPVPQQYALLKSLELPIAAMVHSGGKSVHAIVRIDADNMDQYRKRVDFLSEVCGRNGLKLGRQNRNPSRLSRMPGIMRKGHKQWLIATNIGKRTWQEWEEWIIDLNDDLPDIEELSITTIEPAVAPELIHGILRQGHKMLLSGPSKAHKSFATIQLSVAVAEGIPWMGWMVEQGRVLYVNLELDGDSGKHRFWATYKEMGFKCTPGMIDVWNLRGEATSLDKLTPKLIRRALKKDYMAIIIDPIYKVLTGDENSAGEMAHFCNQFDKICKQLNAATIFCHHHSKGTQGQKQSLYRSSGSGVFSRDPDTIVDLIELDIDEDLRNKIVNQWECDALLAFLDQSLQPGWQSLLPAEDINVADKLFDWGVGQLGREYLPSIRARTRTEAENATGWRLEATLREFPPVSTKTMFFRYPWHLLDSQGLLADAKAEGEDPLAFARKRLPPEERRRRRKETRDERILAQERELEAGVQAGHGKPVSIKELAGFMGVTEKTARSRIAKHPKYMISHGVVVEDHIQADLPTEDAPY